MEWKPIDKPYMKGIEAKRADGITVEVVECYQGDWDVFMLRNDHVCACNIAEHRLKQAERRSYLSYSQAKSIATKIMKEVC